MNPITGRSKVSVLGVEINAPDRDRADRAIAKQPPQYHQSICGRARLALPWRCLEFRSNPREAGLAAFTPSVEAVKRRL
jgi:hypothetical protein